MCRAPVPHRRALHAAAGSTETEKPASVGAVWDQHSVLLLEGGTPLSSADVGTFTATVKKVGAIPASKRRNGAGRRCLVLSKSLV